MAPYIDPKDGKGRRCVKDNSQIIMTGEVTTEVFKSDQLPVIRAPERKEKGEETQTILLPVWGCRINKHQWPYVALPEDMEGWRLRGHLAYTKGMEDVERQNNERLKDLGIYKEYPELKVPVMTDEERAAGLIGFTTGGVGGVGAVRTLQQELKEAREKRQAAAERAAAAEKQSSMGQRGGRKIVRRGSFRLGRNLGDVTAETSTSTFSGDAAVAKDGNTEPKDKAEKSKVDTGKEEAIDGIVVPASPTSTIGSTRTTSAPRNFWFYDAQNKDGSMPPPRPPSTIGSATSTSPPSTHRGLMQRASRLFRNSMSGGTTNKAGSSAPSTMKLTDNPNRASAAPA